MSKEEYLKKYKEDALAEICEAYDRNNKTLCIREAEKSKELNELKEYKDIFSDVNKLFEKLQEMPAKDFISLYYKMQLMMDNEICERESDKDYLSKFTYTTTAH